MYRSGFAGSKGAVNAARSFGEQAARHADDLFSAAGVAFIGAGLALVSVPLAFVVVGVILLGFGLFLGIVIGSAGTRRQPRRE